MNSNDNTTASNVNGSCYRLNMFLNKHVSNQNGNINNDPHNGNSSRSKIGFIYNNYNCGDCGNKKNKSFVQLKIFYVFIVRKWTVLEKYVFIKKS